MAGEWLAPDDDVFPGAIPSGIRDRSRLLNAAPPAGAEGVPAALGLDRQEAFAPAKTYRPRVKDGDVFPPPAGAAPSLMINGSEALTAAGFAVPAPAREQLLSLRDAPWLVGVSLNVNAEGRAEDVFVERACEDADVNRAVIAALYSAPLTVSGQACRGSLTLSFGGNP